MGDPSFLVPELRKKERKKSAAESEKRAQLLWRKSITHQFFLPKKSFTSRSSSTPIPPGRITLSTLFFPRVTFPRQHSL